MIRISGWMLGAALLTSACERTEPLPESGPRRDATQVKSSQAPELPFPDLNERLKIFDELVAHVERLDAEGFEARRLRSQTWAKTILTLRAEVMRAQSYPEFGRVLSRLDATYTNLHSRLSLSSGLPWLKAGRPVPEWDLAARVSDDAQVSFHLDQDGVVSEILELNGRSMRAWSEENYHFCKFPLKIQCDQDLFSNLFSELLSWKRDSPLVVRVRNAAGVESHLEVPYEIVLPNPGDSEKRARSRIEAMECARDASRYPGFRMSYAGNRACVFEKLGDPSIALLRITSFSYAESRLRPEQPLRSVRQEVEALEVYWTAHAARWEHLLIDVVDNGGGNAPVPYYRLLFTTPFQEQYYRLRKSIEMEDPEFLKEVLWEDESQLHTFELLRRDGVWAKTPFGGLFPAIPMFCATARGDCRDERFLPKPHEFRGRVTLLLNSNCISSCDGFVWALKNTFGSRAKLVGQPQAADSTYARARVDVEWSAAEGFVSKVKSEYSSISNRVLFTQSVAISLSTDEHGSPFAGRPLALDKFVGIDPLDRSKPWIQRALAAALN